MVKINKLDPLTEIKILNRALVLLAYSDVSNVPEECVDDIITDCKREK